METSSDEFADKRTPRESDIKRVWLDPMAKTVPTARNAKSELETIYLKVSCATNADKQEGSLK